MTQLSAAELIQSESEQGETKSSGLAPLDILPETTAPEGFQFSSLEGDLFESFPDAIVNVVSCTGVRRNAITKRLARAYPSFFNEYKRLCLRKHLKVGTPVIHSLGTLFGTRYIITLPIKGRWVENMKPPLVRESLQALMSEVVKLDISMLAFPEFEGPPKGWVRQKFCEDLNASQQALAQSDLKEIMFFKEE